MKVAALIPVDTSSIALETVLGVPLFLWAANNLSRVIPSEQILVFSSEELVLSLARSHGFGTLNPKTFEHGTDDFLHQAVEQLDCSLCVLHDPKMIFLKEKSLRDAIGAVSTEDGMQVEGAGLLVTRKGSFGKTC